MTHAPTHTHTHPHTHSTHTTHTRSLGISLLEEGTPELIVILRVNEDELAIVGGQTIIDDQVHPLPKMPEPEVEYPSIAKAPALLMRDHLYEGYKNANQQINTDPLKNICMFIEERALSTCSTKPPV